MHSSFFEKYKHISTGDSGVHMPLFFDFQLNTKIQIYSIQFSPYISSSGMISNDAEAEVSFSVNPCPDGCRVLVVPVNLYYCIAYNFGVTGSICKGYIRNVSGNNHTCGCNVAVIYFK